MTKLHLGCGTNYLQGWVNIDLNPEIADIVQDLRNQLPFPNESVSFIFVEHFIEHLTDIEAINFLRECFRVLSHGGVIRIITPDINYLIDCFIRGECSIWRDVDWEPTSPCRMINEGMRSWGHCFLYDSTELFSVLRYVGFSLIGLSDYKNSIYPELRCLECRPFHNELIVEATK